MYRGERLNGLTHLAGVAFAGVATVVLITLAARARAIPGSSRASPSSARC
jgi:hypothetical protein